MRLTLETSTGQAPEQGGSGDQPMTTDTEKTTGRDQIMKNTKTVKKFDREAGQGAVEYLGAVIVAVVIVAALIAAVAGFGDQIAGFISEGISRIGGLVNS